MILGNWVHYGMEEMKPWREGDPLTPQRDLARGSCLVGPRPLGREDFEFITGDTKGKRKDSGL